MELSTIQKIENLAQDFQDFAKNSMKEQQSHMNSFNKRLQEICKSFNTNIIKIKNYYVDITNKTCSCPHFHYRLKGTGKLCKHLKDAFNEIQSESLSDNTQNTLTRGNYELDLDNKTCSCPHFHYRLKGTGKLCKHLKDAFNEIQSESLSESNRLDEIASNLATSRRSTNQNLSTHEDNIIKIGKYDVNITNKTCSCPHFQYRLKDYNTPCKHLEEAMV
jgi:predicted nucleic acid-binding Zn finger protein